MSHNQPAIVPQSPRWPPLGSHSGARANVGDADECVHGPDQGELGAGHRGPEGGRRGVEVGEEGGQGELEAAEVMVVGLIPGLKPPSSYILNAISIDKLF